MGATQGPLLLALARGEIAGELGHRIPDLAHDAADGPPPWLAQTGASFVTLHLLSQPGPRSGAPRLRGCIGTIEPYRPLLQDVRGNAYAAAFRDPRFAPLDRTEYERLHVEVSVLSPREPLPFRDRAELVATLRPGVDGLVLEYAGRRGTYLPQVWEQISDPDAFLDSLVTKAHLPRGFWSDDIVLSRYTVTAYAEPLQEAT